MANYKAELEFAIRTARGAGELVMKFFGKIQPGAPRDAVKGMLTEADLVSDKFIRSAIEKEYPGCGIITEESDPKDGKDKWIADPIDGTTNFSNGLSDFAIFLAYAVDDKPVVGVAFCPATSELFHAVKGGGAYLNGEKIRVSSRKLGDSIALIACDWMFPSQRERGLTLLRLLTDNVSEGKQKAYRPRISEGGLGPLYIAKGSYCCYVIDDTKPWDMAVPSLLIEEAGGRVTNHKGGDWNIFTKDVLMTNGVVHDEMLEILKRLGN